MSEPLTAPYRLTLNITCAGLTHKQRTYCEASPSVLAPSGYYLWDRSNVANIDAAAAAQALWTAERPIFNTTVNAPTWVLENRVGLSWVPVSSGSLTGAGTNTDPIAASDQMTLSFRAENVHRIRLIVLEGSVSNYGTKAVGYSGLHAFTSLAALADATSSHGGGSADYYLWARSKNQRLLNGGEPLISTVWDLNDKVRRSRHTQ